MSHNQYFRAGTGCIIYNDKKEILLFSRLDNEDIWQLQQGGQDTGESIEETLWRELEEETALTSNDFMKVEMYPDWLFYVYPNEIRHSIKDPNCLGQIHRWFYLKLKPGIVIDISQVPHPEFKDFKWSTFEALVSDTDTVKAVVYQKLAVYFANQIV
jgi:putative (di)nucleoside polyphosphate hydrolase